MRRSASASSRCSRTVLSDSDYIPGDSLLGDDTEGATDGSHPNDLGFMRQADAFEPVLRQALGD